MEKDDGVTHREIIERVAVVETLQKTHMNNVADWIEDSKENRAKLFAEIREVRATVAERKSFTAGVAFAVSIGWLVATTLVGAFWAWITRNGN